MKKTTKGALAATTAGVLLLGGAGSLAFWSDSLTIGGSTISSGHISLDDTTDGLCAEADWILNDAEAPVDAVFDPSADALVPGDSITKTCTFDINAVGDHLRATLAATGGEDAAPAAGTDLAPFVEATAAFTVDDLTTLEITDDNDGDEVEAKITLTFPYGTDDNDSQDASLDLSAYTVSLTQVHA